VKVRKVALMPSLASYGPNTSSNWKLKTASGSPIVLLKLGEGIVALAWAVLPEEDHPM
jgi:hypothetical protein